MTAVVSTFSLHVEQLNGFEFRVKFDKEQFAPLLLDGIAALNPAR